MITIDGLISGIDTEQIIEGLLSIQQNQIDRLQSRRQTIEAKQAAYQSLEVQLQSFKSIADQLARPNANLFFSRNVSVSQESSLLAVANTSAALGTYQIHIEQLARAHQVVSSGFDSATAEITEGTIGIQTGSGDLKTITINGSNNSLQGLANEINLAEAGVVATIVNDGSTGGSPFRLLLTAAETGTANEIVLDNQLAASQGTALQPSFDLNNPVQAATNAQVRLGSGPGALTVQNATNEIKDLIQGVTLNLLDANSDQEIQVRVEHNTSPATTAINDLADTYNAIMDFIDELIRFNPESNEAGLLIGDRTISDIQSQIRSSLLDVVPGLNPQANRLSVLGINLNDRARLTVNATRLEEVLAGRVAGITDIDLKNLFSTTSNTSGDPESQILSSTDTQTISGVGVRLGNLINRFTDFETGKLTLAKDGLTDQVDSLDTSIKRQNILFTTQQQNLIAQFVALESAISELQTTGSFLTSQFNNLAKIGSQS